MTRPLTNALARHTSWSRKALFFSTSCSDSAPPTSRRRTRPPSAHRGCSARAAVPPQTLPGRRPVFTEDSQGAPARLEAVVAGKIGGSKSKLSWHVLTGPHMESARADRPIFDKERNSDSSRPRETNTTLRFADSHALSLRSNRGGGEARAGSEEHRLARASRLLSFSPSSDRERVRSLRRSRRRRRADAVPDSSFARAGCAIVAGTSAMLAAPRGGYYV